MATVPIIQQQSVGEAPLPRVREQAAPESELQATGAAVKGFGQLASSTLRAIEEEKAKADAARAVQATADFTRAADAELLDPTVDPATNLPKGYRFKQGQVAFADRDNVAKRIEGLRDQHREALANDGQRKAYDRLTIPKVTGYHSEIMSHAGAEAEKTEDESYKVGRAAEMNTAVNMADNFQARDAAIRNIKTIARSDAIRRGMPATMAEEYAKSEEAAANAAALTALIDRENMPAAEAFYAQVKGRLGVHGASIEHAMGTVKVKREAFEVASRIAAGARDPLNPGRIDEVAAFGALDKELQEKNPRLWTEARTVLTERIRDQNNAWDQRVGDYAARALQAFMSPDPNGNPRLTTAAVPNDVRIWLTDPVNGKKAADAWQELVRWEESAYAQRRQLKQLPTDEQAQNFLELYTDMMRNPDRYRNTPASQFAAEWIGSGKLSLKDYNTAADVFAHVNKAEDPHGVVSINQMVMDEAINAGLLSKKKARQTTAQKDALMQLQLEVDRQIKESKWTDPVKIREYVRGRLQKVEVKHRFLGALGVTQQIPTIQAEIQGRPVIGGAAPVPAPQAVTPAPAIPPADRVALVARFRARHGVDPTEDELLQFYTAWQARRSRPGGF
jgi:hypothetical protein